MYWDNADEFLQALEGAYGEEEQLAAVKFAEDSGLADVWEQEEAGEANNQYADALEAEFGRLEGKIGRELTPDEEQAIIDNLSSQDRQEGYVPDLVQSYGEQLANTPYTDSGRVHLAAAAAEQAFQEQGRTDMPSGEHAVDLKPAHYWADD